MEQAVAQLEAIVDYIGRVSPIYDEGVLLRLAYRLQLTRDQPQLGKRAPEAGGLDVRELVLPPYRVFYREGRKCVEVLAIVHPRKTCRTRCNIGASCRRTSHCC